MKDAVEALSRLTLELATPFPLLADEAGSVRATYLVDGVGLLLADCFIALFARWTAPDAEALPRAAELGEWLAFLDIQCEECHPPEAWWPDP
jgi:hypothetical protein